MATIDFLSAALDPLSGAQLYVFSKVLTRDASFQRPSAIIPVPAMIGGTPWINPLGSYANPIAPRVYDMTFWHQYAVGETFPVARSHLMAINGRRLLLLTTQPDGSVRHNYGTLILFDDKRVPQDGQSGCEFHVAFALENAYWKSQFLLGYNYYDTGLQYDTGVSYDATSTITIDGISGHDVLHLTNRGDSPEYTPKMVVTGPMRTPIILANFSAPNGNSVVQWSYYRSVTGTANGTPNVAGLALGDGEQLIVDPAKASVTLNGVPDPGNFVWGNPSQRVGQREWFVIMPGDNTVQITQGSPDILNGTLTIEAYDSYI